MSNPHFQEVIQATRDERRSNTNENRQGDVIHFERADIRNASPDGKCRTKSDGLSLDSAHGVALIFRVASTVEAEPHTPMNTNPLRAVCVFVFTCTCTFFSSAAVRAQGAAGAAEKALLGEWEGHVVEGDGSNQGQRRMNIFVTITDKKITANGGQNQPMGDGTYKNQRQAH